MCAMMRGVKKQSTKMTTSKMTGVFKKDPKTRSEFMQLIANSSMD